MIRTKYSLIRAAIKFISLEIRIVFFCHRVSDFEKKSPQNTCKKKTTSVAIKLEEKKNNEIENRDTV